MLVCMGLQCNRHTRQCTLQLSVIDAEQMFGWVKARCKL